MDSIECECGAVTPRHYDVATETSCCRCGLVLEAAGLQSEPELPEREPLSPDFKTGNGSAVGSWFNPHDKAIAPGDRGRWKRLYRVNVQTTTEGKRSRRTGLRNYRRVRFFVSRLCSYLGFQREVRELAEREAHAFLEGLDLRTVPRVNGQQVRTQAFVWMSVQGTAWATNQVVLPGAFAEYFATVPLIDDTGKAPKRPPATFKPFLGELEMADAVINGFWIMHGRVNADAPLPSGKGEQNMTGNETADASAEA